MGKLNTIQNGKGSKPRPIKDYQNFLDNWDSIFSKKTLAKSEKIEDTPETYEKHTVNLRDEEKGLEGEGRTLS